MTTTAARTFVKVLMRWTLIRPTPTFASFCIKVIGFVTSQRFCAQTFTFFVIPRLPIGAVCRWFVWTLTAARMVIISLWCMAFQVRLRALTPAGCFVEYLPSFAPEFLGTLALTRVRIENLSWIGAFACLVRTCTFTCILIEF